MKLVYNPEPVSVPYADGRFVDPQSWAYIEDELNDPRLVEVEPPESVDSNTEAAAIPAIQEAVKDRQSRQEERGDREEDRDDAKLYRGAKSEEESEVRNTGSANKRTRRSTTNKEA